MSETLRILDVLLTRFLRVIKLSFTFKASNFFQKRDIQMRKKILQKFKLIQKNQ